MNKKMQNKTKSRLFSLNFEESNLKIDKKANQFITALMTNFKRKEVNNPMRNKNGLTVGYIRSAVKDNLSVKRQNKTLREFSLSNGYKLASVFTDNGYSGVNLNRPALQELLTQASSGKIQRVIAVDAARFTRNLTGFIALKSLMEKYGVEVNTVIGITKDAGTQLAENLCKVVNSWEAQVIKSRRKQGK